MTLWQTLNSGVYGRFTYLQWILLLSAFIAIIAIGLWVQSEIDKPAPENIEGIADGIFDGKRYVWKAKAPITEEYKNRGCYNQSYAYFWGNITFTDGTSQDVSIDGRKIEGVICKEWVDSYVWQSSDQSYRTPIRFWFKGTITPMPFLDLWSLFPYIGWGLTIVLLVWALVWRKIHRKKFDCIKAEDKFVEYLDEKDLVGMGEVESEAFEAIGGLAYTVGQKIKSTVPFWLILTIDNNYNITRKRVDKTGEVWRTTFGKEGLQQNRELAKMQDHLPSEKVYEALMQRLKEKEKEKGYKKPTTVSEKEDIVGDIYSREGDDVGAE